MERNPLCESVYKCDGFDITNSEHFTDIATYADGVIWSNDQILENRYKKVQNQLE